MPAVEFPGRDPEFAWNDLSPRIGVTYRIDDKTIVRGSYARFASQLDSRYVYWDNPAGLAAVEYLFFDANGDHVAQASELLFPTGYSYGLDPADPTQQDAPHVIDPNLSSPKTHAFVGTVEHELRRDLSVGTSFGYNRVNNQVWAPYIGVTSADFTQAGTAGTAGDAASTTPIFNLAPEASLPPGNGQFFTNRDGYHQRYWNVDVFGTKRLSNRWMLRGSLTLSNHQEFFDDPSQSIHDPTPRVKNGQSGGPNFSSFGAQRDGGIVYYSAGSGSGPRGDVYVHSKWQYHLMGLYELPLDIDVSGTIYGRQGYPNPEFVAVSRGALGSATAVLLNPDLDAVRYDSVHVVDVGVGRRFNFGRTAILFDVDIFNLLNTNTVLQQNRQANSTSFRQAREIVAPRLVRFGVRFQF